MGTRQMCNECGLFFIIGQEDEKCPHGQLDYETEICPKCNGNIEEHDETVTLILHRECSDEIHLTEKY